MIFLFNKIHIKHAEFLENYFTSEIQFDEMETYEASKAKPLSIALVVCGSGKILDASACKMPARGKLAEIGKSKYNWIVDDRLKCVSGVLATASTVTSESVCILCDKKTSYRNEILKHIPHAKITQVKSRGRKTRSLISVGVKPRGQISVTKCSPRLIKIYSFVLPIGNN